MPDTISDRLHAAAACLLGRGGVPVLGLSGAQGSGKSTAAAALPAMLGARVAILSLDDFYLPRADRLRLASEVSPLLSTRGVPGTHDIAGLRAAVESLKSAAPGGVTHVPRFDKIADDRLPADRWNRLHGRPDLILVEGWCTGAVAAPDFLSGPPLNAVEREDSGLACRRFQHAWLTGPYLDLWKTFDAFIHLVPPSWETVAGWRKEQERGNLGLGDAPLPPDRDTWVEHFVQHYERITRDMAAGSRMPGDVVQLDAERRVV